MHFLCDLEKSWVFVGLGDEQGGVGRVCRKQLLNPFDLLCVGLKAVERLGHARFTC